MYSVHTATTRRLTSPRGQRFELTLLPSAPSTFQSRGAPAASSTSTAPPPPQSTAPLPSGLPSRTADDKSNTARAYHLEPSGTTPRVHSPRAPHGPSSPRLLLSFPQPLAKARRCCVRAPWRHGAAPRGESDGGLRRAFGGPALFPGAVLLYCLRVGGSDHNRQGAACSLPSRCRLSRDLSRRRRRGWGWVTGLASSSRITAAVCSGE